uniref:Remodeling and spacing factor 1b, tandem duplicate 1 n=1 Tax=Labrus bergylta TaxID=56723 RepID=A0A3Q3GK64_9LABR
MAASAATASSSPGLCPNYAVICSFLERYGALLDLPELTFPQLERYLRDTSSVPKLLAELHVKLLRKIGKSVSADRWEKYLIKICQEFNSTWAWELEQKGYKDMTEECKTGILKYLCECQFDDNVKFKTAINEEDPDKMRLQPIGRDKDGQMYWYQLDQDDNVRVYVEEQDDLDGSSWKCIVRDRNDLAEVLALLKTQIDPELLKRDLENKPEGEGKTVKKCLQTVVLDVKENTQISIFSHRCASFESFLYRFLYLLSLDVFFVFAGEVKKNEDTSDEDNKDSKEAVCPKTENNEKDDLKPEASEAISSLNGVIEGKPEAELHSEKPSADHSVSTKAQNIKEEPMEVETKTQSIATSEQTSEAPGLTVKPEKAEEAKKSSAEEIQQALKNDQQAKIPLKKRGMKFTEDFDKNSGIKVQNPPVTPVKEALKADSTPEQTKKAQSVNDHVNGEVQPTQEKELKSNSCELLNEAAVDKEEAAAGKTVEAREKKDSDKDDVKDKKEEASSAEKVEEKAAALTEDVDKKSQDVNVTNESSASKEKKEEAQESPPTPTEPPASQKDENNALKKSSNHEEVKESRPADKKESCTGDGTTLKEADKSLTTEESKEVKSKDSEEKPSCEDMDTSETSQAEDTKTSETETAEKQTETNGAKETTRSETDAEKTDTVIKTSETQSTEKDPAKTSVESEKAESPPPVVEKTEKLKDDSNQETREVTASSADKAIISEKAEESVKSSVVQEKDQSESCKPVEEKENIKDAETTPEKDDATSDTKTEKPEEKEKAEDVKKSVNCDDRTMHDAGEMRDSTPVEEEATAGKPDVTETQEGEKTEMNSVAQKATEEASEGREDKPSKRAEKSKAAEVDDGKSDRPDSEREKVSEEQPKEVDPSSEIKRDAEKGKEKGTKKEKVNSDIEKPPCEDKESKEDSTTEKMSKNDESKEEKTAQKERESSPRRDDSERQNGSKESEEKSSAETGKESKEADSEKPTDEESKSKSEEEESATKKEVANGEEAAAEVQVKTPHRRRRRGPTHRRKAELQREERERQGDSESDTNTGMSLRRSPRISRPTPKAVEINDRKLEKSQVDDKDEKKDKAEGEVEEEEEEEEEEVKTVQKKPREKKTDQEGQPKPKVRPLESEDLDDNDDLPPNDDPCKHCGLPNHPELILLCDSCDNGYHTACLRPPLMIIPDGEWFCPPCQHKLLCDKLEEQLTNLDASLKKKERAVHEGGRRWLNRYITACNTNVERTLLIKFSLFLCPCYRFDEFDEAIEEAIEEDIKEAEGGGAGRGKDMANITGHRGKDISTILQAEEGKENGRPPRSNAGQRRKKRRRLNDLDSDSTVDEEESEEEFCLSESSEEEFVVSENDSEAESEAESNNSEVGGGKRRSSSSRRRKVPKRRRSSRKRRRPRGYSDDEEEETDEEDEDEIGMKFSDSDLDMSRRRSRRSHKKQVNYHETSESDGSQAETNKAKVKLRRPHDSSESEGQSGEEKEKEEKEGKEEEEKPKEKKAAEQTDEESKGTNPADCNPTNGQNPIKPAAAAAATPGLVPNVETPKNTSATPAAAAAAAAPNGLVGQESGAAAQEEDEDDLLGVTDLVDYVCNNEDM